MQKVKMSGGQEALVDDCDFKAVSEYRWRICRCGYAMRHVRGGKSMMMHRMILQVQEGMVIDHINGDPLDNRRENLRVCTRSQNQMNRRTHRNNTTGFKGVSFHKKQGKYLARIGVLGKLIHLGSFNNPEEAHLAYLEAAKIHHKDFVRI